ncbi:hypothetical protein EDB89DRAFT_1908880 [Lactarius sanguifluus]|nr:hypothetical protein EDB89DRAFT_1908880 [Lactarius sanguifluus]
MDFPSQFPTQLLDPTGARRDLNVIAAASEQMLEQNGFYVRLQYNSMKQKEEILALHEANSELKKEVELLKERNETYRTWLREIINGSITKDSDLQQMVSVQSKGTHRVFSLANPPLNPMLQEQEDHPDVFYWDIRIARSKKIRVKQMVKQTRPKMTGTNQCHFYLEYHDGTLVSREDVTLLSQKARMVWFELDDVGLTPPTFGQMTKIAWDFFWHSMVAYPEFQFLLLCKGGEWKLRQWSIKSYSGWAAIHGVREVKPKATDTLDGLNLIELDPEDKDSDTDGDDDDQASAVVHPYTDARSTLRPTRVTSAHVPNHQQQCSQLTTAISLINAPDANSTSAPNGSPSDAALGQPTNAVKLSNSHQLLPLKEEARTLTTVAPAPSSAPVDIGNIDAISKPSQPDTDGIHGNDATPRPMLDAAAMTPSDAGATPPSQNDSVYIWMPCTPLNLGPGDTNANPSKKRKSSNNVPPVALTKKQKSSGALAIPTQTNSIRNICMRHWNQLQPGGQGTAAHFDAYYKALSDAKKEVHDPFFNATPPLIHAKPFRKQMYIGRGATRKANAAVNKGTTTSTSS